jgi:cytochrome c-L
MKTRMRNRRMMAATLLPLGVGMAGGADAAATDVELRNTVTGEMLNLDDARPEERDTPAVKYFLRTGRNPYVEVQSCMPRAKDLFLSACSGCHGQVAEGKIGPGLNDNYWTYPSNTTDAGLFSTVFGGARAQMGPQYLNLTLDEMLLVESWVRHLYAGPIQDAPWLTPAQKENFTPYKESEDRVVASDKAPACKPAVE